VANPPTRRGQAPFKRGRGKKTNPCNRQGNQKCGKKDGKRLERKWLVSKKRVKLGRKKS